MYLIGLPLPALYLSNVLLYTFPTGAMNLLLAKKVKLEKYALKRCYKNKNNNKKTCACGWNLTCSLQCQ